MPVFSHSLVELIMRGRGAGGGQKTTTSGTWLGTSMEAAFGFF